MSKVNYVLAGRLIDGSGGPIQERVVLKIAGGKITAIEQGGPVNDIDPSLLTDLSHCTILPPLIDSHVHLFMSGTTDHKVREEQLVAGYEQMRPVIGNHLHYLFSHGVLGVRDGGDWGGYALRYRSEEEMHPEMVLKVGGRAYHKEGRYGSLIGTATSDDDSLADLYNRREEETDHIKLVNSGLNSLLKYGKETPPQYSADEIAALVRAAANQGKRVMVHANGKLPVQQAVEADCHSIEHGFFMGRDNLALMAEKGTFWVPTVFTMKGYASNISTTDKKANRKVIEKNIDHQLQQLRIARELGVKVALGTDSGSLGVLHGESMVEEMKLFKKAGYTLPETVKCATSNAAELLGIEEFGMIADGKAATFLVSRGSPAQLPRKLSYLEAIYVDGEPSKFYRKNPVKHLAGKE